MRTLVLNAGFEPLHLVSWQKAICLVVIGKADVISEYQKSVRTVSREIRLPSVVRLRRYVRAVQSLGRVRCTRKNVFLRDDFSCQYCARKLTLKSGTIDHVVPKSKGGRTQWRNVVAACVACNRRKGDKAPVQKGMSLLREPTRPAFVDLLKEEREEYDGGDWLDFLKDGL